MFNTLALPIMSIFYPGSSQAVLTLPDFYPDFDLKNFEPNSEVFIQTNLTGIFHFWTQVFSRNTSDYMVRFHGPCDRALTYMDIIMT